MGCFGLHVAGAYLSRSIIECQRATSKLPFRVKPMEMDILGRGAAQPGESGRSVVLEGDTHDIYIDIYMAIFASQCT